MKMLSFLCLLILLIPVSYLILIAVASAWPVKYKKKNLIDPLYKFLVVIPAHDEANVISSSVQSLLRVDYPHNRCSIHVVADYCTDHTADNARQAGAFVHERNKGPKTGKGAAISWLFNQLLPRGDWDAVVIFDADTKVDQQFLRVMATCLSEGIPVIQGQHIICNPSNGWFPALTWAMFLIDNRFQNFGRSNLGLSAKNMGDSICFRADILTKLGWGEGLTEDYQLRQRLLLEGIQIKYEPKAIGYGEAPLNWDQAQRQRARWLRGTRDASKKLFFQMLHEGFKQKNLALLDGALQAVFPSYSTLTILVTLLLLIQLIANKIIGPIFPQTLIIGWVIQLGVLFLYPFLGLALEHAPFKAYLVILSGPIFILWRTWLAIRVRFFLKQIDWIRTPHGGQR